MSGPVATESVSKKEELVVKPAELSEAAREAVRLWILRAMVVRPSVAMSCGRTSRMADWNSASDTWRISAARHRT